MRPCWPGSRCAVSVPLLAVDGLSRSFGKLVVLSKLDLAVEAGGGPAINGPDGAGKNTVFYLVTGGPRPGAGDHPLAGREIRAGASRPPAAGPRPGRGAHPLGRT